LIFERRHSGAILHSAVGTLRSPALCSIHEEGGAPAPRRPLEQQEAPSMSTRDRLGGIIHTYQKFDPVNFPSPTAPPPDLVSPAFEHLLFYGNTRRLTEEELARAIHLDPSQIRGLGPSLEALMAILRERKRKILETYETDQVQAEGAKSGNPAPRQPKK
jgi:hypothetical protein